MTAQKKEKALPAKRIAKLHKALDAGKGDDAISREFGLTRHQVRKVIAERAVGTALLTLPLDAIDVGSRIRQNYGDIAALARSIDANGLLHPIVVRKTPLGVYELVAGERRLRAWRESKFKDEPVPVRIIDLASIRRGEFAENHERKAFTPSEYVAIKDALEIEFDLSGEAERRKRAGKKASGEEAGQVRDLVGAYAGRSGRTVEKAEAVVKAAEEDPERFGRLKDQMDQTGKVDGPFKRLQNIRSGDALRAEPPPLPGKGPYRTIVIDPPWPAEIDGNRDTEGRGYYPYPTMRIRDICAIDVASIAHPEGCALWLWVTNFHLVTGSFLELLDAWGFFGATMLTWCKPDMGQGQRLRGATEHAVLAVRGDVPCLAGDQKTWFVGRVADQVRGKKREHSGKPGEFFDIVEKVTPASRYAYLFAGRSLPENWDGHGDRHVAEAEIPGAAGVIANLDGFAERLGRPEDAP
jgi:N6-adenosine-specific RNA methylase IME4/ParB-like chromosome segregation protein Spo0J